MKLEWISAKPSPISEQTPSKRAFSSLTVLPFIPGQNSNQNNNNNNNNNNLNNNNNQNNNQNKKITTLFMFGGQHAIERGAVSFRDAQYLVIDSNLNSNWELLPCFGQIPCHRCGHTTLLIPETRCLLVYGGFFHQALGDCNILDLDNKEWKSIRTRNPPPPRCGHTAHFLNNAAQRMLIFGGYTLNVERLNDIWLLNFITKTWTEIRVNDGISSSSPSPSPSPRFYHSMIRLRPDIPSAGGSDQLLVFGGRGDDNPDGSFKRFDDFYVLDTEHWKWKEIKVRPECNPLGPRSSIAAAHVSSTEDIRINTGKRENTSRTTPHSIICIGGCRGDAFNDAQLLHYQMTSNRHTPNLSFDFSLSQPQHRPPAVYGRSCVCVSTPWESSADQYMVVCWGGTAEITQESEFIDNVDVLLIDLSHFTKNINNMFNEKIKSF